MSKSRRFLVGMPTALLVFGTALALIFGACDSPTASEANTPEPSTPVNVNALDLAEYVTAPATGAVPETVEIDTHPKYQGTVVWKKVDDSPVTEVFEHSTVYKAVVELTKTTKESVSTSDLKDITYSVDPEKMKKSGKGAKLTATITFDATEGGSSGPGTNPGTGGGDTTAPADVSGLAVTLGNGEVTLTWTDPPDADLHHIEISLNGGTAVFVDKKIQTYTATGLFNNGHYTFSLRAVDEAENRSAGVSIQAIPVETDPTAPANVSGLVAIPGDRLVTLSWTDPADADLHHIKIKRENGSPETVSKGIQTYTAMDLTNGTRYTFTVYAVNEAGKESVGVSVTAIPVPPDFAGVNDPVGTLGDRRVTLTWTDPTNADLDHIEIIRDNGSPETVSKGIQTYTATGLTNGTTYTFTIKAVYEEGDKSAGKIVTATPGAPVSNLDLTGMVAAPVKGESVVTEINDPQYTGTIVWREPDGDNPFNNDFDADTVYKAVITLTAKPGFSFDGVAANSIRYNGNEATITNEAGNGGTISVTITFPATESLAGVQNLSATPGDEQITLTWTDPKETDLIRIEIRWTPGNGEASVANGTQTYTADGFANWRDYTFTVTAVAEDQDGVHRSAEETLEATPGETIDTYAKFERSVAQINEYPPGEYFLVLSGNITTGNIVFEDKEGRTGRKLITIRGNGSLRTITNNANSPLFTVRANNTLVLDGNVKLDGDQRAKNVVYVDGGDLIMNDGSSIENPMGGGPMPADGYGRGVYVTGGGTFTMTGGMISGNSSSEGGGGVFVTGGTFMMTGGMISGNSSSQGGGVFVTGGTFTMTGGTISGNASSQGGGVSVGSAGEFMMTGGTISGNSAVKGGGVYFGDGYRMFTKAPGAGSRTSGTIYGKDDNQALQNTADSGYAYYVFDKKSRDTTAGPTVPLNLNGL